MIYTFKDMLEMSLGTRKESDIETIKDLLYGCVSVVATDNNGNDEGIDFIATLRPGTEVFIDVKTRAEGCSKYWKNGEPELAIETWSVIKGGRYKTPKYRAKPGWTYDESKKTDMVLYTFAETDTDKVYLLPFQSLRLAAINNYHNWIATHKVDIQTSDNWQSQAIFVPSKVVVQAILDTFENVTVK